MAQKNLIIIKLEKILSHSWLLKCQEIIMWRLKKREKIIFEAKKNGADAIKLQTFTPTGMTINSKKERIYC